MSDITQNQPEPEEGPADIPQLREAYKRERARARELAAQQPQNDELRRENAMLRAGVDLTHPVGELFSRGYQGELDVEAVKDAWDKVAPAAPTPPATTEPPEGEPTAEEIVRQQASREMAGGAHPPGGEPSPDPKEEAYKTFWDLRKAGKDRERAGAFALDKWMEAAAAGDERVLYDPERWHREHA